MDRPGKILTIIHQYKKPACDVMDNNETKKVIEKEETFDFIVYGKCDQDIAEHIKKWFYRISLLSLSKRLTGDLIYSLTSVTHTFKIYYDYKNPTGVIIIDDDKIYIFIGELYIALAAANIKHTYIHYDTVTDGIPEYMRLLLEKTGHDGIYTDNIIKTIEHVRSTTVPVIDILLNDPKASLLESVTDIECTISTAINSYVRTESGNFYRLNNLEHIHDIERLISMDKINQGVFTIIADSDVPEVTYKLQKAEYHNFNDVEEEPVEIKGILQTLKKKSGLGWLLDRFTKTR